MNCFKISKQGKYILISWAIIAVLFFAMGIGVGIWACQPMDDTPYFPKPTATPKPDDWRYGDVNGDGCFTPVDILIMERYVQNQCKLDDESIEKGDINGDGVLNMIDVILWKDRTK